MARKPNKKPPRRKPPSVNQRLRAQAKSAAAQGRGSAGQSRIDTCRTSASTKREKAWDAGNHDEAIWYYERRWPVIRTIN